MNTFMQIFENEKEACDFAERCNGEVILRYGYDYFYHKIKEEFVVYYN